MSLHAQKERCEEEITIHEIKRAILGGKIIESYPNDPRGTSYLILGYSRDKPLIAF
ncbi:MAG: DUF4258 domain-containing protein [Candidatus Omnitrophica bacterium]|nr:DUF4258 domain-containing protein [Candidatus Omnitrophota bacterium]MBU1524072.1 DUF4258 domain-containing protein [Candidatus Omnitrophota bacterium]MBU2437354.1 DUF4258 domain-containing protein [Candidatus Omnitrophota bacterium]